MAPRLRRRQALRRRLRVQGSADRIRTGYPRRAIASRTDRAIEAMEARCLFAIDWSFSEAPVQDSIGDTDTIRLVADVTGDGVPEIFVESQRPYRDGQQQAISVYRMNDTSGTLERIHMFPSSELNRSFVPSAAVDLDRDGDQDLLITTTTIWGADYIQSLDWLPNLDGRGTWGERQPLFRQVGSIPMAMSDFDEDGDLDFAFIQSYTVAHRTGYAENRDGVFVVSMGPNVGLDDPLLNVNARFDADGDGILRVTPVLASSDGRSTVDLNGDGQLDLLSDNGSWQTLDDYVSLRRQRISALGAVRSRADDIDADGDMDVWIQTDRTLRWYENSGNGTFTGHVLPHSLAGIFELVQLDDDPALEILDLDSRAGRLTRHDFDVSTNRTTTRVFQTAVREEAQAAADLNGDGLQDLIGLAAWYEQAGDGSVWITHRYPDGVRPSFVAVGDRDASGRPTLVLGTVNESFLETRLEQATVQADGTLAPGPLIGIVNTYLNNITMTDVDGDADADLVAEHRTFFDGSTIYWWENVDGRGSFVDRSDFQLVNYLPKSIYGDFDGDGDLDMAGYDGSTSLWYERTSDGRHRRHTIQVAQTSQMAAGDLDGDYDLDLVSLEGDEIVWYENRSGQGDFSSEARRLIRRLARVESVHLADLNGDGDLDIVVSQTERLPLFDPFPGEVPATEITHPEFYPELRSTYYFFQNEAGRGQFSQSSQTSIQRGPLNLVVDLNGDDWIDFVESPSLLSGIIVNLNSTVLASPADVNRDGQLNVEDIDYFCAQYESASNTARFDRNGDGRVDRLDHRYLVQNDLGLKFGDANADGRLDSADLVLAFSFGAYENANMQAAWQSGDWDCDGRFTTADLVLALQESFYEGT